MRRHGPGQRLTWIAALPAVAACGWWMAGRPDDAPPDLAFDHALHAGEFEMACEDCHGAVADATNLEASFSPSPEVAFELGAKTSDPLSMYLSDIYTVSANLAGIPGVSIPCGMVRGLPVGLQLLGPALGEAVLLRVADAFERRTPHQARRPEPNP